MSPQSQGHSQGKESGKREVKDQAHVHQWDFLIKGGKCQVAYEDEQESSTFPVSLQGVITTLKSQVNTREQWPHTRCLATSIFG